MNEALHRRRHDGLLFVGPINDNGRLMDNMDAWLDARIRAVVEQMWADGEDKMPPGDEALPPLVAEQAKPIPRRWRHRSWTESRPPSLHRRTKRRRSGFH